MTVPVSNMLYSQATASTSSDVFVNIISDRDPTSGDKNYKVQKRWINSSTGIEWYLLNFFGTPDGITANWIQLGGGGDGIRTLTGNDGIHVPGDPHNINVVGESPINVVGDIGSHTLTIMGLGIINDVRIQVITSSGTYTPTDGMVECIVEIVGGGGGGGASSATINNASSAASGGSSGGYARKRYAASDIGGGVSVTIGAGGNGGGSEAEAGAPGGDTFFGSSMSATGGYGGLGGNAVVGGNEAAGTGPVGIGINGDLNIYGSPGGSGVNFSVASMGGYGGSSYFGGGANPTTGLDSDVVPGNNGSNYGGGGSGGTSGQNSDPAHGGNGSAGVCVITEFISS